MLLIKKFLPPIKLKVLVRKSGKLPDHYNPLLMYLSKKTGYIIYGFCDYKAGEARFRANYLYPFCIPLRKQKCMYQ